MYKKFFCLFVMLKKFAARGCGSYTAKNHVVFGNLLIVDVMGSKE